MIRAHLLRWRPRLHAQRRETTPRVQPSGAASQLDPSPRSSRCFFDRLWKSAVLVVSAALALSAVWGVAPMAWAQPAAPAQMQFRVHPIVDQQQGGLVLGTITVPQSWKVTSRVEWKYADVSHPVRAMARAEAPDGSAWVEYFPVEIFYWLEPVPAPVPVGQRGLGMIHAPNVRLQSYTSSATTGPTARETTGARMTRPITPTLARAVAPTGSAWIPRGAEGAYLNAGITCLV